MRKLMRSIARAGMVESRIGGINRVPPGAKNGKSKFASLWRTYLGYVIDEKPTPAKPLRSPWGRKLRSPWGRKLRRVG